LLELRIRNKISEEQMARMAGKMMVAGDIDIKLTNEGPVKFLKPNGQPLAIYLPKVMRELCDEAYPILHELKNSYTSNRGMASGSQRVMGASKTSYARAVDSAIIGSFDRSQRFNYCRLTAWSGKETEKWHGLFPFLQGISKHLEEHVPDRFAAQMQQASITRPDWVIAGTPFTTVTVNNTYATGVHQDKGDLHEGFSTIVALRKGEFKGGTLCFPEYRLGVDLQHGDLILMDAHEWHGNIEFDPKPKRTLDGKLEEDPGFERISVVTYFRTNMVQCASAAEELARKEGLKEDEAMSRIMEQEAEGALVGE
jgi:hypothetical protein